jgi:hypothetical protein
MELIKNAVSAFSQLYNIIPKSVEYNAKLHNNPTLISECHANIIVCNICGKEDDHEGTCPRADYTK